MKAIDRAICETLAMEVEFLIFKKILLFRLNNWLNLAVLAEQIHGMCRSRKMLILPST